MLTYRIDFYDYLKVPINFIKFRFFFPKDTLDESIKNETNTLGSTYSSNSSFDSSNSSSTKKINHELLYKNSEERLFIIDCFLRTQKLLKFRFKNILLFYLLVFLV
jgi:hypothetical protein